MQTVFKVVSGGPIQFPGGYPRNNGDIVTLDDTEPRLQEIYDYAPTRASFETAVAALVTSGAVKRQGVVTEIRPGYKVWTYLVDLNTIATGEVARVKPGFSGRVMGYSFIATVDATTAAKAASIGLEIEPHVAAGSTSALFTSSEVQTLTETGAPTGGNFDANIAGVDVLAIAYNTTKAAFQAKIDATSLLGKVTVGGTDTTGPWTLTYGGALANTNVADPVITGHFVGGTSPAIAVTSAGGGNRVVGASGNPATLDLTSANVSDGGVVAGETIATGTNASFGDFGQYDFLVLTAASVTAFVEGQGIISVYLKAL